ncbi:MAG TPA: hypothetical protein PKD84_04450 [Propionicimonas sp.]|nr:hypothetical protein [Propionicimonas sp.]
MTTVGITGHQGIPDEAMPYVRVGISEVLSSIEPPLYGVSCLAAGADQVFADSLLAASGELIAIIPCADYESTFDPVGIEGYRNYLDSACEKVILDFDAPSEAAFMAGGEEVVSRCDRLVAVWDGKPSQGLGGTADVVALAHSRGVPVSVVWPPGVTR